jgi:hypothetical protein
MTGDSDIAIGPGIHLRPEERLSADWAEFLGGVAGAATDFFIKGPGDGAASGVSALIRLITSVKAEQNVGARAWSLAVLSFAWSLDETVPASDIEEAALKRSLKAALDSAKTVAAQEGIFVPATFLDRPTTIGVYNTLKSVLLKSLPVSCSQEIAAKLSYKLDAAYNKGVYELWSRKPEYYTPIAEALGGPSMAAAESSLNWESYRRKLVYDFEVRPVFGQEQSKVALRELYVPLRAVWPKTGVEEGESHLSYSIHRTHEIGIIDDLLDEWLVSEDQSDWLRLIGGGPGSGKSTTIRSFARRLADLPQWRPLLIPLQHIDLDSDLRESIGAYFSGTSDSQFTHSPLARSFVEDDPPLVLLFDGLDEIVAPGEAAKDVVGTFANRLNSLVSALSGPARRPIKVVVSGRMPAFQAARRYLTPKRHGALEACGFLPVQDAAPEVVDGLWVLDQRPLWWRGYARATEQKESTPEAFSNERLAGVTHEPLLCYLLALSGFANEDWQLAADNRNRMYAALIDSIYERGWGEGAIKRQGAGRTLAKRDFNKLMETIALAAWLGGDARVASEEMFQVALKSQGLSLLGDPSPMIMVMT